MEISFQHTNPSTGHDSTLLTVSRRNDESSRYLIDAGDSVSPDAFIGPDESIDGIFLTHAHNDHYSSLGKIYSSSIDAPLYTSPPTATILEQVYSEADQYQNLGAIDAITEALTSIETWTRLSQDISVLPVPAGHTPGATAFLFRIDDLENNDETVTILATGDFTTRPVAGYSDLVIPDSIDVDIMIANATTSETFQDNLSGAVETILERGLSGATTLVASGALTGVHLAYILGQLADHLGRCLPIHLVGQAAKLYTALDYEVPAVTAHAHFDHTDEVLDPGAVTIAGPEGPSQGSIRRLFGVIKENPDAAFVQLSTSDSEIVDGVACATHHFELSNHPTEQQFLDFVDEYLPRHLVFKHVGIESSKSLGSSFENLFRWGNDDMNAHILYDDGTWAAPPWVSESGANRIRQRNYQESDIRIPLDRPINELPSVSWDRQSVALEAEGIDVVSLTDKFETTQPQQSTHQNTATSDGGQASVSATPTNGEGNQRTDDESVMVDADQQSQIDSELQMEVVDRLEAIESTLDNLVATSATEGTVETRFESIEARLEDVETTLEDLPEEIELDEPETMTGTVIRQNDLILLRFDSDEIDAIDQSFAHDEQIEISLQSIDATH